MKQNLKKTLEGIGFGLIAAVMIAACQPTATGGTPSSTQTVSGSDQPILAFTVSVSQNAKLGNVLVDNRGMTLYTFKNDASGVSNCTAGCVELWPPLSINGEVVPTAGSGINGKLGVITRDDGATQVTYNGMPLYTYVGDQIAGETNGQGIDGLWYAAAP